MKRRNFLNRRNLQKQDGQVMIEYSVIFALIAVVTAIATVAFFSRICRSEDGNSSAFERYYNAVEQRITR